MSRLSTLFSILMIAFAAFGLYMVKYKVKAIQEELAATNHRLDEERQAMHVVKAEWAYLTRPERLQELAAKHLALAPIRGDQLAEIDQVPSAGSHDLAANLMLTPASAKITPALMQGDDNGQ